MASLVRSAAIFLALAARARAEGLDCHSPAQLQNATARSLCCQAKGIGCPLPACEQGVPDACRGCSGEQCLDCQEEGWVKCCINAGAGVRECCALASRLIRAGPVCALAGSKESNSSSCDCCSGEPCAQCNDEDRLRCCLRAGGSKEQCCFKGASGDARARLLCRDHFSPGSCDPALACAGCMPGLPCLRCYAEEQVACCAYAIPGSLKETCCSGAGPGIRSSPICRAPTIVV
mmetsp:Transcript_39321/g.112224  ORF Transcript_39321/g.112224 Transcript_39321/m.112224 type:complete len:233 (+) Transcript_39321:73-771(+)